MLLVKAMNKLKLIIKKIGKPFYVFLYNQILGINLKYPHFDNLEVAIKLGTEWQEKFRSELKINTTSLDVGCGTNPRNPFLAKTFMVPLISLPVVILPILSPKKVIVTSFFKGEVS